MLKGLVSLICLGVAPLLLMPGNAAAREPVALILDVSDLALNVVEPFSEVYSGDAIHIPAGETLEFTHYSSCANVIVQGGTVTFTERFYLHKHGNVLQDRKGKCPKSFKLTSPGNTGGVILRSSGAPILSPRPTFLLSASTISDFGWLKVLQDGNPIIGEPLGATKFDWPAQAPSLKDGVKYTLQLIPRRTGTPKIIEAIAKANQRDDPILLVIR